MPHTDRSEAGIYWQSRMGNNADGIGGNCHRYDIVTEGGRGTLVVDVVAMAVAADTIRIVSHAGLPVDPGFGGTKMRVRHDASFRLRSDSRRGRNRRRLPAP